MAQQGAYAELVAGYDATRDNPVLRPDPVLVTTHLVPRSAARAAFAAAFAEADRARTIVHDNGIWNPVSLAATRAARHAGLPYVVSPHGMLEPWAPAYHA